MPDERRAGGPGRPSDSGWALTIPEQFGSDTVQRAGVAGEQWLRNLPSTVESLLQSWELTATGPVMHGYLGLVFRVQHRGRDLALKLSEPSSAEFHNQVHSLAAWKGVGMVRLLRYELDQGAILMEWLDHSTSLDNVEIHQAVDAAAALLRKLSVIAPPTAQIISLGDHVQGWPDRWLRDWERLGRPLHRSLIDAAAEICQDLTPRAARMLVDHDLHYRNILDSGRAGWLAVDPKGVIGDPEFSLGPLMWNRFGGETDIQWRFDRYVDQAGLDVDRARGWLLVSVVDFFLWSTGVGLTYDPAACRAIAEWVVDGIE